jgi:phospho-N-acetylmuramoyl-pentapeptide-transferase
MVAFGIWTFLSALVSFIISAVLGRFLIPYLHKLNFGQTILDIGPSWHKNKQGTPVMGGIMFIVSIVVTTTVSVLLYNAFGSSFVGVYQANPDRSVAFVFAGLGLALCNGAIGFIDDFTKVVKKRNLGLTPIQKLVLQFAVAIAYLVVLGLMGYGTSTTIPFVGTIDLGWFYYVIAAIVIVGVVNAVNLTDGVDGLDGSITLFVALFFMLIASYLSNMGITFMAAAVAGGCLGFLVWNAHPAKVFMGDTGSLFLGGIVCALAFAVDMPVLLLPMGIVYLCEIGSVVLQVTYFKLTHGKRLFKMSPIHHHFEMCGWSENKIVTVFSLVTALFGIVSLLLVYFGVK